jgi:thiol-disulfide isomerase/thioredoxin
MPDTRLGLAVLIGLALSAGCSGSAATPAPTATVRATTSPSVAAAPTITPAAPPATGSQPPTSTAGPTVAPTGPATPAPAAYDQPWAVATLTDVTTGEQFSIADVAASGKVVFVETMAIWCTNCRAQQKTATEAFAQLDPNRVVWVGIDVETSETAGALARYRETNGFPFRYAISNVDLSRALVTDFGDVVLSPPSVNVIVLGTDGRVMHLTGHHSAAEIVALAAEYGA